MTDSALTTALKAVQTDLTTSISDALPIAAAVFATIAGIYIGFKFFKRLTGAKS